LVSVPGKLSNILLGRSCEKPPIWLMRQAGRYLPEYKQSRAKAGSFWQLCMNPTAAAEVTLQPVRRFDFDAAIIFSDIMVVPYALGREVRFDDGTGPRVEPVNAVSELCMDAEIWAERLSPVCRAIECVAAELADEKDLIGFAGGPWTLATYMTEGGRSSDQSAAKLWAYRDEKGFGEFLAMIAACVAEHLLAQIEAGASVVQLFDSWAAGLSEKLFRECVIAPSVRVVEHVRKKAPHAKIIGFPRGATEQGYRAYVDATRVDAISLDTAVSISWAVHNLAGSTALQGNLDPLLLKIGGTAMHDAIGSLLHDVRGARHVVNLGHGVLPDTPVEHVEELVRLVRGRR
jgi:uroporphyrinogen decarboxylase